MCPESSESNKIYLYKAIKFPCAWEKVCVLAEKGRYVDTTFFTYDNALYGFTYKLSEKCKDINGELYIFKIVNGKAVFLDNNPISKDDRVARPAGKCIIRNNKLIRVSQNCDGTYGKGLMFSEINFDGMKYEEKLIHEIYPKNIEYDRHFNLIGVHTFNEIGTYQVIDLRSNDFSIILICQRIVNKICKTIRGRKI